MKPHTKRAVKALSWSSVAMVVRLVVEFAVCVGATGAASTAVHVPGVLQTGAAAFAALTGLRYFLVPVKAAEKPSPQVEAARLAQLAKTDGLLQMIEEQMKTIDTKPDPNKAKAAGPYL
jgi:hypothetical protein